MPLQLESHKKILLRERKRHTARRVASTTSVVLTQRGGVHHLRSRSRWGVPHPRSRREVPHPWPGGTPSQVQTGGTPSQVWMGGLPHPWGYPSLAGVPHCPDLGWGTPPPSGPGQGTPVWTWLGYPPEWTWPGYPLPIQT